MNDELPSFQPLLKTCPLLSVSGEEGLELWVSIPADGSTFKLDTGILEPFVPLFNADGRLIYVEQGDNRALSDTPYFTRVMRVEPEEGAIPEQIGGFPLTLECDGSGLDIDTALLNGGAEGFLLAAATQYSADTGFGGNAQMFELTPYGILHSLSCGGMGYSLFDPETGNSTPIAGAETLMRGALTPDGTALIAIRWTFDPPQHEHTLVRLDLTTGVITDLPTTHRPEQLAVAPDGIVYYTSYADPSAAERTTSIYRYDPASGGEQLVIERSDWFGVTRLTAPETFSLVFNAIPNASAMAADQISQVYLLASDGSEEPQPVVSQLSLFSLAPIPAVP